MNGELRCSEKQFMQQVIDLARLSGFLVYHTYDSRRSQRGFPDLVMVRPPTVLFVELKSEASLGRLRPEQREWLEALSRCESVSTHLWRPGSAWPEIETTLAKAAPRA